MILDGSDVLVFEGGLSAEGAAWRGEFRSVANARFAAEAIIAIDSPEGVWRLLEPMELGGTPAHPPWPGRRVSNQRQTWPQ